MERKLQSLEKSVRKKKEIVAKIHLISFKNMVEGLKGLLYGIVLCLKIPIFLING